MLTSNSILFKMSRISAASGKWLGWRATMHSCKYDHDGDDDGDDDDEYESDDDGDDD